MSNIDQELNSQLSAWTIQCVIHHDESFVDPLCYLRRLNSGQPGELNKGNERYPARQDTDIHEVSMVSAPHRSGPATSRRLDDWRLLGGSPTEPKEHQPQRNQYRHRRGVTDHGPRCVTV